MKAIALINYFIAGCIASSLLGWTASLHPLANKSIGFLVAASFIFWCLCWLLDFSTSKLLKITVTDLQACLVGCLVACLVGWGVFLCT